MSKPLKFLTKSISIQIKCPIPRHTVHFFFSDSHSNVIYWFGVIAQKNRRSTKFDRMASSARIVEWKKSSVYFWKKKKKKNIHNSIAIEKEFKQSRARKVLNIQWHDTTWHSPAEIYTSQFFFLSRCCCCCCLQQNPNHEPKCLFVRTMKLRNLNWWQMINKIDNIIGKSTVLR